MPLTLKVPSSARSGLVGPCRVFHYTVLGAEQGISIAKTGWKTGWQIYRWDGHGWRGSFKTAEEALAALQGEVAA